MSRFRAGKKYTMEKGGHGKRGRSYASYKRTFVFLRVAPGFHVQHHIFRNVPGGYLESFTEDQLDDYRIEKVA